jgi:DNA-directed RNA polymerase subunit M/transcription elongation factor TFIIS
MAKTMPCADEAIALCLINGTLEEEPETTIQTDITEISSPKKQVNIKLEKILKFIASFHGDGEGMKCSKCGKDDKLETFRSQTRACDEMATEMMKCLRCEIRWSVN